MIRQYAEPIANWKRNRERVMCCKVIRQGRPMEEQWHKRITIEPGKRGGRPCVRGMRITVYDVLSCLAAGMSTTQILDDFPYLTIEDIHSCLAFAADRELSMVMASS